MKMLRSFIAAMLLLAAVLTPTLSVAEEGVDIGDIEISINGMPADEVIGDAAEMFMSALEENLGEAIEGLNGVFDEFAVDMSEELDAIAALLSGQVPQQTDVQISYFSFGSRGSSSYDIYTYEVYADEETGEMTVNYDLYCIETYAFAATDDFMAALNGIVSRHELWNWDGFSGADMNVLDGSGFGLDIIYADETVTNASGSNIFPDGYAEAADEINALFIEYLEENGVVPEDIF